VAEMAVVLYAQAAPTLDTAASQRLRWAALLHEIGLSVAHSGFHKHGAYILWNADMPGFSAREQQDLARMVLACRGGLGKALPLLGDDDLRARTLALRLAVLFHHSRRMVDPPRLRVRASPYIVVDVQKRWRKAHPLSDHLLANEEEEWRKAGWPWNAR